MTSKILDPSIVSIAERIAAHTSRRAEPGSYDLSAGVAVCFRPAAVSPEILFILRAEEEGDPWSGHVALPGGRLEPGDASIWETAIRETREETGLDLASSGTRLGLLDDVHPRTPVLPSIAITPCAFAVPRGAEAHAAAEVQEVAWIPLADLTDPARASRIDLGTGEGVGSFPSIRWGRYEIWGLTHRILMQLFDLIGSSSTGAV